MRLSEILSKPAYRYSPVLLGLIALPVQGHESPAAHSHVDHDGGAVLSALPPTVSAVLLALGVVLAVRWWRARR